MKIMITADDFGWSQDVDDCISDCVAESVVTNVSVLAYAAIQSIKRHPLIASKASVGLHLCMWGEGREIASAPESRGVLADKDGFFYAANRNRCLILSGKIPAHVIRAEVRSQIAAVHAAGVRVDYVDGHGHCHKLPHVFRELVQAMDDHRIRRVRRPQNIFIGRSPLDMLRRAYGYSVARQIRSANLTTTDFFFMPIGQEVKAYGAALSGVMKTEGVVEVGVHPGRQDDWRVVEAAAVRQFSAGLPRHIAPPISWADVQDE